MVGALLFAAAFAPSSADAQAEVEAFGGGTLLAHYGDNDNEDTITEWTPPIGFGARFGAHYGVFSGGLEVAGMEALPAGGITIVSGSLYATLRVPTGGMITPRFSASLGIGYWSEFVIFDEANEQVVLTSRLAAGIEIGEGRHRAFAELGGQSLWSADLEANINASVRLGWTARFGG